MNMSGNLMMELISCVICGAVVGGAERMRDAVAKQTEPRRIANIRINTSVIDVPKAMAVTTGTMEIITPVIAEASISPNRIAQTETGVEMRRSSVLPWLSDGKITGAMAEQVKKTDIAISPGIMVTIGISLPKAKEIKKKIGKRKPMSTTGPLE